MESLCRNVVIINYFMDGFSNSISYRDIHVYRAICRFMNNPCFENARIDSILVNYSNFHGVEV